MTATHQRCDRGAGMIGAIGGLLVFLTLLTFAVQLLFNLYANSAVTAAAHDAAHLAASGSVDHRDPDAVSAAIERGETHARTVLGGYHERVDFDWQVDTDRVRLTVTAEHPSLAMDHVASVFGLNRFERTVEVRVERTR